MLSMDVKFRAQPYVTRGSHAIKTDITYSCQGELFNNLVDSDDERPQAPTTCRHQVGRYELYDPAHPWNTLIAVYEDEGTSVSSLVATTKR